MKKINKNHGMAGNRFMEVVPGPSPVPNPSRSVGVGVGGLPLFHEGGVRAGGDWETLPSVMMPLPKQGYDEHRFHGMGPTKASMMALEVDDAHEEGEEGSEDAEDMPPSSKPAPPTTGKMGMGRNASCGFRGCGFAAKDHGLMAKHRLSSHGLK